MTATQLQHVVNGMNNIRRLVFCAYLQLDNQHNETIGTYFSQRRA